MKKLCVLMCLVPGFALAHSTEQAYAGVKLSQRTMGFKSNFGDNMWAKNSPQVSVFGGYNFNEWLGAELDLFTTTNKKKSPTITSGTTVLGTSSYTGLASEGFNNKSRLMGATLKATARYTVAKNLNVFAGAGVGFARLKNTSTLTNVNGAAPTAVQSANNNFTTTQSKLYPTVGVGADYRATQNVGLRADVNWEGTSAFKKNFRTTSNPALTYKAKDSLVYGVSVYYAM